MEIMISAVVGLLVGGGVGFFVIKNLLQRNFQAKQVEFDRKCDDLLKDARRNAENIELEANRKAEKSSRKRRA